MAAQIEGPVNPDQPITIDIYYFNPGRAPATGINRWYQFPKFVKIPEGFDDWPHLDVEENTTCDAIQPIDGDESIYPNALNQTTSAYFTYKKGLSQSEIADITAGTLITYIDGCMRYFTVDKPRKSGFCFYLPPSRQKGAAIQNRFFASCPKGQKSD